MERKELTHIHTSYACLYLHVWSCTQSPIGRWRGYCLAVASCAYVCAVLRESEDDMLFAEMAEAAAAAVSGAGGEVRDPRTGAFFFSLCRGVAPSRLRAYGNL